MSVLVSDLISAYVTLVTKVNPIFIVIIKKTMIDHVMANRSTVGLSTRMIKPAETRRTVVEYTMATVSRESFRTVT